MSKQRPVFDMHIHTEFSPDSSTPLRAYAEVADQLSIHIGFLDHFELAFMNRQNYLNYNSLPRLLESFDNTQSQYPDTSLGLEIDFYSDQISSVAEFCDGHRKDFDYFIGTVHTIDGLAVTIREELETLITRIGLAAILRRYFDEVEGAIRSGLFDGIAHIDGVMRFVPLYNEGKNLMDYWHQRTFELGKLCVAYGIPIEINLRGLHYPWGQTHPSQLLIAQLIQEGAHFFVGSDSHKLKDFENAVPQLRKVHAYLMEQAGLELPLPLKR
jgi:histidinol-phosphatase (PHP family)